MLTNLTFIILTALVAPFGTEATAGYGAAGRLDYMLVPIVFGVWGLVAISNPIVRRAFEANRLRGPDR